jgi:hypothetical protein
VLGWICGWNVVKNWLSFPTSEPQILPISIQNTNQYPACQYVDLIIIDGCEGLSGPFGMCWVGFVAGMLTKLGLHIFPTSEPKSCQSPSRTPINILLAVDRLERTLASQ